jgi:hypothetical protein
MHLRPATAAALLVLPLLLPAAARAGEDKPKVSVEGTLYADWSMDLSEGAQLANEFQIGRAYLTAKGRPHEKLELRITTDIGREKAQSIEVADGSGGVVEVEVPEDTSYRPFLKYAWLEWKDALPGVKLRAGMVDTPFPGYYDKFWDHRFASKAATDEFKVLDTADLGVAALGKHKDGLVDWHLAAINGAGYKNPDEDRTKAIQGRFTLDPAAGKGALSLPVSLVGSVEPTQDGDPRVVALGAAGVGSPHLLVWGEGFTTRGEADGLGASGTLMPRHPEWGALYARLDWYDPDTTASDDATTRIIGGVSHRFADKVQAAVQLAQVGAEASPDAPERVASLRLDAGF